MLLVYEFMQNGNLQDALLHRKCPELMEWKKRFAIAVDIAKGLAYLHGLEQPIIHGDIKPSNILLDRYFSAKIGDFGLARLKLENQIEVSVEGCDATKTMNGSIGGGVEDCGSVVEETDSVVTGFEESNVGFDLSPESFVKVSALPEPVAMASPATSALTESPEGFEKASASESNKASPVKQNGDKGWWLRQDNGGVKDYVMEWIGTEIKSERPSSDWIGTSSDNLGKAEKKEKKKKKGRKQLEWWMSMDDEKEKKAKNSSKKEKRRPAREWWKEEYCEELAEKKKKKMKQQKGTVSDVEYGNGWWLQDEELYTERKRKNKSRSQSRSSLDWWLDGLSGELRRSRRNRNHDSASGEIPRSGFSSTPSMRGTVCYVAPETGFGDNPSEKCDVYSFGVSFLVLIAGRRPLQVTSSPISEYKSANLLSWARHLARAGKLADLVDKSIQSLDQEQALLCITVALLCLQKIPARRPSMKEVVGMLTGESEPPQLPADLSPSPQSRFPLKTRKPVR